MRRLLPLLLALPLAGRAQEGASAPANPPPPAWSLGAGMSFGGYYLGLGARGALASSAYPYEFAPALPAAGASLERRVGERSWLALGIVGAAQSSREDVPTRAYGVSRGESRWIAVSCGLRRAVTAPGAPVELSLLAGATVGHLWTNYTSNYTFTDPTQTATVRTEGWSLGADVGLAVDRELSPGLSLRVATPLASVTWSESRRTPTDAAAGNASQLSFGVGLSPRLELRLAF